MYFQNVINTSVTRGYNCNRMVVIIISLKMIMEEMFVVPEGRLRCLGLRSVLPCL